MRFVYFRVFWIKLYTWFNASRLSAWGKGSTLAPFATLQKPQRMSVGSGCVIREHAWLNCSGNDDGVSLAVGDGCYLGRFIHINAFASVRIEDKVLIADRVHISDISHNFENVDMPVIDQSWSERGPVLLKSGCWIGTGVVILPGATIGRNAVVAANAVVKGNVPDFAVVGGVPAKIIRMLK